MIPENNLGHIEKSKLSNDPLSQLVGLTIMLTVLGYYIITQGWHKDSPIGLLLIFLLDLVQTISLHIPKLKDKTYFNSGGIFPLSIYNLSMFIAFVFYIPLYSPFVLVIAAITFITVYFKGIWWAFGSFLTLAAVIIVSYLRNGLPNVPDAKYFPYLLMFLGINFIVLVYRAGSVDNKIRVGLSAANKKIADEREQLNTLINGIKDAVIATDENGNIIFYNSTSLKILGIEPFETGTPFSKIIRLYDERSNLVDFFGLFIPELEQQSIYNLHIIDSNNQIIYLAIEISKIVSTDNEDTSQGVIILIRDITKEKSLDDERDEFVAVTSHELRTPIAIAEANLSLAMDKRMVGNLDPSAQDRLKQAHDGIMNLADLVNQLTELSDVEKKNLEVENQYVDPHLILEQLRKDHIREAQEKGLEIKVENGAQVGQIFTSKIYVSEILENFVTNAIKYTDKGTITLKAEKSDQDANKIRFSVADTGDGIGNSDKDKIFTKFYRAEDYRRKHTRGTGLGLYLTLRIAKAINGNIWFTSELHKGSVFYLEVPIVSQKVERPPNINV